MSIQTDRLSVNREAGRFRVIRFGQARGRDTPLDLHQASRSAVAEVIGAPRDRIANRGWQRVGQPAAIATLSTVITRVTQRVGGLVMAAEALAAALAGGADV